MKEIRLWETPFGDLVNIDVMLAKLSRAEQNAVEEMIAALPKNRRKRWWDDRKCPGCGRRDC